MIDMFSLYWVLVSCLYFTITFDGGKVKIQRNAIRIYSFISQHGMWFLLNPGEEVKIMCPHGVIGSLLARAITPNGQKRKSGQRKRKNEKKSSTEKQLDFEQLRMDQIEDREADGEASSNKCQLQTNSRFNWHCRKVKKKA